MGSAVNVSILLDIDGVVAGFAEHYLDTLHKLTGFRAHTHQIDRWHFHECEWFPKEAKRQVEAEIEKPGWCYGIPLLPHAIGLVGSLREIGTVYAVTSPWASSKHWMYERTEWLHHRLGIRQRHVVHTMAKSLVAGDVLIDDKPENVEDWAQAHAKGRGILFTAPHNRLHELNRGVRASSPGDVIGHVQEIAGLKRDLEMERFT